MATVTGLTAARMLIIEAMSVISGHIVGDNLVLTRRDGTEFIAGNVRGPAGPQGIPGSIEASPAGGVLSGNYPNPGLAPDAITDENVSPTNIDGAPSVPSLRTLGTGEQQAAAGDHDHGDLGWISVVPSAAGQAPFATKPATYLQYRKFGPMVMIRFRKDTSSAIDFTGSTGNFSPNMDIFPAGTIPTQARPDDQAVRGVATMIDSPQGVVLGTDGSITWVGGEPRLYNAGATMAGNFAFLTSN